MNNFQETYSGLAGDFLQDYSSIKCWDNEAKFFFSTENY